MGLPGGQGDVEVGQHELPLQLGVAVGVEQGDLQQVVALEHVGGDAQLLGHQARGGDAAALAVAAVLHLLGGLVDVAPLHRHGAGEAGDSAAALLDRVGAGRSRAGVDLRAGGQ